MIYEFIKIVNTRAGEVAYLLDTRRGVVVRALVEDMPGMPLEVMDDNIDRAPYRPRTTRRMPVDETTYDEQEELPPPPPMPRRKSIMPPELRGVFKPADTPGADVERRTV